MKDDQNPSDYIDPPRSPSSTPPGAKVAREFLHGGVVILGLSSITVLRFVDRLDESHFMTAGAFIFALYFALKKGEGAPDAQSIIEALRGRP